MTESDANRNRDALLAAIRQIPLPEFDPTDPLLEIDAVTDGWLTCRDTVIRAIETAPDDDLTSGVLGLQEPQIIPGYRWDDHQIILSGWRVCYAAVLRAIGDDAGGPTSCG